ncbi:MAG: alpha/beta fold hydrolase [Trebonia sp.]
MRVTSTDGVRLAVYSDGDPGATTIVAVHGYPDNHSVWDGLAALLAERYRVVRYDVRGAGASDAPGARGAYRMGQLVDDLGAVLDAVSPSAPVHLLGHDWGSVQCWPALAEARVAGRIASFTSVSGPSLDHTGAWLRDWRRHAGAALRQLASSYYVALFQLPVLPELLWRSGAIDAVLAQGATVHRAEHDKINGLELYRANIFRGLRRPASHRIAVPVQVIAPRGDVFVSPALQTQAPVDYVDDLRVRIVDSGHWVICEQPDTVAGAITDFVNDVEERSLPA